MKPAALVVVTVLAVVAIELAFVAYFFQGKEVIVVRDGEAYFVLPSEVARTCREADFCSLVWRTFSRSSM